MLRTGHADPVIIWSRTAIIILLVGRQVLTMLENQALTRTLEDRVRSRTSSCAASRERSCPRAAQLRHRHASSTATATSATRVPPSTASSGYDARTCGASRWRLLMRRGASRLLRQALGRTLRPKTCGCTRSSSPGGTRTAATAAVEITITNLLDNPHVSGLVLNTRDVTERRAARGAARPRRRSTTR